MNAPSELNQPPSYWLVECEHCRCSVRYDDYSKMVWDESAIDTRHGGSGCRRVAQVTKVTAGVLF